MSNKTENLSLQFESWFFAGSLVVDFKMVAQENEELVVKGSLLNAVARCKKAVDEQIDCYRSSKIWFELKSLVFYMVIWNGALCNIKASCYFGWLGERSYHFTVRMIKQNSSCYFVESIY